MHIMIIEDNEKIRNELSDFLHKNGYVTSAPDDFEHILESIDQLKPDLLLLDLNLPVMDIIYAGKYVKKALFQF